ncbi:MAG: 3-dehydroquinate synthase, partial [Duncaniella sp.]|nr:3-dehydroquinate synthase [Duncaniella sp.]
FDISEADADRLLHLLEESVRVKERIVTADPREKGIRRALNLGHTVGHAFESIALERHAPVPHGQAVAWGTLVEMILSHIKTGFPSGHLHTFASYLKNQGYGVPSITCDDYPRLISLMRHDKKNDTPDAINFTLLREVGEPMIDQTACEEEIKTALDIFRDLLQ